MDGAELRKLIGSILLYARTAEQSIMNVYQPLSFPQMLEQRTIGETRAQLMLARSSLELAQMEIKELDNWLAGMPAHLPQEPK